MVSKIIFHIGDHKTGSTSIQMVLAQKSWSGGGPSLDYMSQLNNRPLAMALFKESHKKNLKPQFESLVRKINRSSADIAIVSDEAFETVDPAVLVRAIDTYMPQHRDKVHVIAYVRPHADRIRATYTQTTKLGINTRTVEEFVEHIITKGKFYYTPRFSAWRDQFPGRFTLRPMIRSELVGQDVVRDFFHILLDGAAFDYTNAESANTGLPFADLMMLRDFHLQERKKQYAAQSKTRGKAAWHLSRMLESMPAETSDKMLLPHPVNDRLAVHFRDDARQLDQAFFDKPLMETALAKAPGHSAPAPLSYDIADHLDGDGQRLAAVLGQLADDLLARNPGDWRGYFRRLWMDEIQSSASGGKTGGKQVKGH